MKTRKTVRTERPARQARAYLIYALVLIGLAYLSPERWITLLCAVVSVIAAIKAASLLSEAIFYRDEFLEDEFVLRIGLPRN